VKLAEYKLISADSHVSEPPDLWAERVDQKYRERAPHLMVNPPGKEGAYFYYEGFPLHPIGIGLGAGKNPEELKEFLTKATYADARPGGWDPAERVKDNAADGVEADVLYTTLGFRIFWLKDPGLQADCFRVYNDWLAEFVSYDPKHMAGLPMISLYDPKAGARELERCAKMGLKGAMIWCSPPDDRPYSSDVYDPFWAAAQELKMPVSLHAITGMGMESQFNWGARYMRATVLSHEVEKSFSVLIFSGVLDRFPELQIVSAENNIGWLPYYLQRMDRAFERQRISAGFTNKLKPSEYFRRQMWATYIDDFVGVANRNFIGVDRMMWSSDYPHQASTWPHSGGRRARLQGRQRRRPIQDHPRQRRPALRLRRVIALPPTRGELAGQSVREVTPRPQPGCRCRRRCRIAAGTSRIPARRRLRSRVRGQSTGRHEFRAFAPGLLRRTLPRRLLRPPNRSRSSHGRDQRARRSRPRFGCRRCRARR
jgi:predicted TIM-barrel fold metal-dependent hydrolase